MKKFLETKELFILTSLFLFLPFAYLPSQQIELSLRDLCERSNNIILARVISTQSFFNDKEKRILTNIKVEVTENFKGELKPSSNLVFTVLGGTVNGTSTFVLDAPTFNVNEESILFLSSVNLPNNQKNHVVVGLSQGKFNVSIDPITKVKKVSREQIEIPLKLDKDSSPLPLTSRESIALNEFVKDIDQYLK